MECYACSAKVAGLQGLRAHFRQSPDCHDRIEAESVARHERELGSADALLDDREPLTALAATIYERRGELEETMLATVTVTLKVDTTVISDPDDVQESVDQAVCEAVQQYGTVVTSNVVVRERSEHVLRHSVRGGR